MTGYDAHIASVVLGVVVVEASKAALGTVADALGAELPRTAASVPVGQGLLHRTGPESVVILTDPAEARGLAARLEAAVGEASAIVADLSDGHAWLAISGRDALDVLAQGLALDLRETAFAVGQATRTLCFGIEAILVRDDRDSLRVGCRASHGEYLLARVRLARDPLPPNAPNHPPGSR